MSGTETFRIAAIAMLSLFLLPGLTSCNGERSPKFAEELPEEQATLWQEQRDEFIELSERQLDELEQQLRQKRQEDAEPGEIEDLENRIGQTRYRLEDLGEEDAFGWDELRSEIADSINTIQNEVQGL